MDLSKVVVVISDSEAESEDEGVNELPCGNPDCRYHYPNQQPDHEIIMEESLQVWP